MSSDEQCCWFKEETGEQKLQRAKRDCVMLWKDEVRRMEGKRMDEAVAEADVVDDANSSAAQASCKS